MFPLADEKTLIPFLSLKENYFSIHVHIYNQYAVDDSPSNESEKLRKLSILQCHQRKRVRTCHIASLISNITLNYELTNGVQNGFFNIGHNAIKYIFLFSGQRRFFDYIQFANEIFQRYHHRNLSNSGIFYQTVG